MSVCYQLGLGKEGLPLYMTTANDCFEKLFFITIFFLCILHFFFQFVCFMLFICLTAVGPV